MQKQERLHKTSSYSILPGPAFSWREKAIYAHPRLFGNSNLYAVIQTRGLGFVEKRIKRRRVRRN